MTEITPTPNESAPVTAPERVPLDCLVVDDDALVRLCLEHMIRLAGHHVTGAADGLAAKALVTEYRYDVVVTDLRMPKLDGWALFSHIRLVSPHTKVILMTAYPTAFDAKSAAALGAFEFLGKPIDSEEFTGHLARIAVGLLNTGHT